MLEALTSGGFLAGNTDKYSYWSPIRTRYYGRFGPSRHRARSRTHLPRGSYVDAWEVVEQYREATRYASKHDVGSSATASTLGIPRERLRTLTDDGDAPDAVLAIETARSHG